MNTFVACIFLVLADLASAATDSNSRGCIYVDGQCSEACPEGTHAYSTGCGYLMPEATCTNPNPVLDKRGQICDFSSCYCDAPTVRDEKTNQCVPVEECSC